MTMPNWQWQLRHRRAFISCLAETGDPAAAAAAVRRPIDQAYRLRDTDMAFAAEWEQAIAIAWEQVEARVLVGLLKAAAATAQEPAGKLIDHRMALALLQRRDAPQRAGAGAGSAAGAGGKAAARRPDTLGVERLRAEIRALAGPVPGARPRA
jgi:hypothetical protein